MPGTSVAGKTQRRRKKTQQHAEVVGGGHTASRFIFPHSPRSLRKHETEIIGRAHLFAVEQSTRSAPRTADGRVKDGVETHSSYTSILDGVRAHISTTENSSEQCTNKQHAHSRHAWHQTDS